MPQIPIYQQQVASPSPVGLSAVRPVQLRDAIGVGVEQAGRGVMSLGQDMAQVQIERNRKAEQLQQEQDALDIYTARSELGLRMAQDLAAQREAGTLTAQEFSSRWDKEARKAVAGLSPTARDKATAQLIADVNAHTERATLAESEARVEKKKLRLQQGLADSQKVINTSDMPEVDAKVEMLRVLDLAQNTSFPSEEAREAFARAAGAELYGAAFESILMKDPDRALELAWGKNEFTDLTSTQQLQSIRTRVASAMTQKRAHESAADAKALENLQKVNKGYVLLNIASGDKPDLTTLRSMVASGQLDGNDIGQVLAAREAPPSVNDTQALLDAQAVANDTDLSPAVRTRRVTEIGAGKLTPDTVNTLQKVASQTPPSVIQQVRRNLEDRLKGLSKTVDGMFGASVDPKYDRAISETLMSFDTQVQEMVAGGKVDYSAAQKLASELHSRFYDVTGLDTLAAGTVRSANGGWVESMKAVTDADLVATSAWLKSQKGVWTAAEYENRAYEYVLLKNRWRNTPRGK